MKKEFLVTLCTISFLCSSRAMAFRAGLSGGSLGVGTGHSNAADFASPVAYKAHVTFRNKIDLSLAATHLLVGRVYEFNSGAFVLPAAGFILDGSGSGPGVSALFGFTFFCWGVCFYSEFQQQLGFGPNRKMVSGYSARIGLDYTNEK